MNPNNAAYIKRIKEMIDTLTQVLDQSWNGPLPDWCREKASAILLKNKESVSEK